MLSAALKGALQSARGRRHVVRIAPAGVVIGQHVLAGLAGDRRPLWSGPFKPDRRVYTWTIIASSVISTENCPLSMRSPTAYAGSDHFAPSNSLTIGN